MIFQPQEVGFQGKNIHVSAGEGMKQLRWREEEEINLAKPNYVGR